MRLVKFIADMTDAEKARADRAHSIIRELGCTPFDVCTSVGIDGEVQAYSVETMGPETYGAARFTVAIKPDGRTAVNNRYV